MTVMQDAFIILWIDVKIYTIIKNNEGEVFFVNVKASEFTLGHLMNLTENSGEKWRNLELILASADAWGLLRKDLITALGVQRAKRFLMRYGYQCGEHEARILKEAINWDSEVDWLVAGSKLHHLTGRAYSYPENFQVNMEKGLFNVSGYWIDSFEARQHSLYFPLHKEPVCYYLVGYASGYTSACMGKQIIFKEEKCRGKGDDYCSYIGKTIEEWGDEVEEEIIFYEDNDMSGELDQMYRKVEMQKERLEIGFSLSQNLNKALLKGRGLTSFAKILGESIKCQVIIEDRQFREIASYGITPGMENHITAKNSWSNQKTNSLNDIIEAEIPGQTFKLITAPIVLKDQIYGFVTIALKQKLDSFYKDILERVVTAAALQIQNERIAIETEQRLKGELLEQLLKREDLDVKEIYNRFSYLGYDLSIPHYILHIEMESNQDNEETVLGNDDLSIRNKLNHFFQEKNKYEMNMLILTKWNKAQMIVSKPFIDKNNQTIFQFAQSLLRELDHHKRHIYIGVSEETNSIQDFHRRAKEAKQAAKIAKLRTDQSSVLLASDLGHLSLLLYAREPNELKRFAEENLQPILDYDQTRNAELLQTLFHYSQNEFNVHKTAREMCISISGMRYRLRKIEELIGTDLSNSNNRFSVQLSLQILLLFGKINL